MNLINFNINNYCNKSNDSFFSSASTEETTQKRKKHLTSVWCASQRILDNFQENHLADGSALIDLSKNKFDLLQLEEEELGRLDIKFLNAKIKITLPKKFTLLKLNDVDCEVSLKEILIALMNRAKQLKLKIERIDLVGGGVPWILGDSYFKRTFQKFSEDKVGIPSELLNGLSRIPSDFDIRVIVDKDSNHASILLLNDEVLSVFNHKMKDVFDRKEAVDFLKSQKPRAFSALKQTEPTLLAVLAQQSSMKGTILEKFKPCFTNDKDIQFVITAIGKQTQEAGIGEVSRAEILTIASLKRKKLFTRDGLSIPLLDILEGKKKGVKPGGSIQELFDRLCNYVRVPDKDLVNEDDWFTYISLKTNFGAICPEPSQEREMFQKMKEALKHELSFETKFISIMQKLIGNHHGGNLFSAIAYGFNACMSMKEQGDGELAKNLWKKVMGLYLPQIEKINDQDHPVAILAKLSKDQFFTFEYLSCWLQVLGFLHLHRNQAKGSTLGANLHHDGEKDHIFVCFKGQLPCYFSMNFDLKKALGILKKEKSILQALPALKDFYNSCLPKNDSDSEQQDFQISLGDLKGIDLDGLEGKAKKLVDSNEFDFMRNLGYQLLICCHSLNPQNQYILDLFETLPKVVSGVDDIQLIKELESAIGLDKASEEKLSNDRRIKLDLNADGLLKAAHSLLTGGLEVELKWILELAKIGDPLIDGRVMLMIEDINRRYNPPSKEMKHYYYLILKEFVASSPEYAMRLFKDCHAMLENERALEILFKLMPARQEGILRIEEQVLLRFFAETCILLLSGVPVKKSKSKSVNSTNIDNTSSIKLLVLVKRLYEYEHRELADKLWNFCNLNQPFAQKEKLSPEILLFFIKQLLLKNGPLQTVKFWENQNVGDFFKKSKVCEWHPLLLELFHGLLENDKLVECSLLIGSISGEKLNGRSQEKAQILIDTWIRRVFAVDKLPDRKVNVTDAFAKKGVEVCLKGSGFTKGKLLQFEILNAMLDDLQDFSCVNDVLKFINENCLKLPIADLRALREKALPICLKKAVESQDVSSYENNFLEIKRYYSWFSDCSPKDESNLCLLDELIDRVLIAAQMDQMRRESQNEIGRPLSEFGGVIQAMIIDSMINANKKEDEKYKFSGALGVRVFCRFMKHPGLSETLKDQWLRVFTQFLTKQISKKTTFLIPKATEYYIDIFIEMVFSVPLSVSWNKQINLSMDTIDLMREWLSILPIDPLRKSKNISPEKWMALDVYLQGDIYKVGKRVKNIDQMKYLLKLCLVNPSCGNVVHASHLLAAHGKVNIWNDISEYHECLKNIFDQAKHLSFHFDNQFISSLDPILPTILKKNQNETGCDLHLRNGKRVRIMTPELLGYLFNCMSDFTSRLSDVDFLSYAPFNKYSSIYTFCTRLGWCYEYPKGECWFDLIRTNIFPAIQYIIMRSRIFQASQELEVFIIKEVDDPQKRAALFIDLINMLTKLPLEYNGRTEALELIERAFAAGIFDEIDGILVKFNEGILNQE